MGVEKGSAFLLKVGNGNVPATYETVAGMRSVSVSASGGPGWRSAELDAQDAGGTAESLGRTAPRVVMG